MAFIVFNNIGLDPDDNPVKTITFKEGEDITLFNMVASVDLGSIAIETFPNTVMTIISFDTPDGIEPWGTGPVKSYQAPSVNISALEYKWVIDGIEYSGSRLSDVPSQIDFMTAVIPDPTLQKNYDIVVKAISIGTLGTKLESQTTYTIVVQNNWDGDIAELEEVGSRSTSSYRPCGYVTCKSTGHGQYPPQDSSGGASSVFLNGKNMHKLGDLYSAHQKPPKHVNRHTGNLSSGSSSVYVEGVKVGRISDDISCGSKVAEGSSNVLIGN